jgi:glycosyltransferase involved in cell wall biosynthesis
VEEASLKILLISPILPQTQPSNAVALVVYAQIVGLTRHHDLTLATIAGPDPQDRQILEHLPRLGARVYAVWRGAPHGIQRWKRRWCFIRMWAIHKYPWRTVWFWEPAFQHLIDKLTARESFDVIQVEDNAAGLYRFPIHTPRLLTEHEVRATPPPDSRVWPGCDILPYLWRHAEWRRWARYQPMVWHRFHAVQVFTPRDAAALLRIAPDLRDRVWVNPFGIQLPEPADPRVEEPGQLVFVGGYSHPPNVDAALWLAREIMPLLRARCPVATLTLVGSDPSEIVRRLAREDVRVTGYVPAVEPYLARAQVVVAPVRLGGGMRMKVLQALAMGKAVVTTPLGAEGLSVEGQRPPLAIAEDASGFVEAIAQLLASNTGRQALGAAARLFVVQHHSAEAYARRLEQVYHRLHTLRQGS